LYDLSTDRAEANNLADTRPEKARELEALWERQLAATIELASKTAASGMPPRTRTRGNGGS
jgi:hypothetical protein